MPRFAPGRYAAIDIGTVTCRLLVADVDQAGICAELTHGYKICNLGEGVDASHVLLPSAMKRVCDAVAEYQQVIASHERMVGAAIPVSCMTTSAARDARNSQELVDLLAARGIRPLVIPGSQEAALSFSGATSGFEGEAVLVVDIGGGSTEVVAGNAGEPPVLSRSFNIGCRRVTERFFFQDPPSADQVKQARIWIDDQMSGFFAQLRSRGLLPARMIAVAGTATSVVSLQKKMEVYDRDQVHRAQVSARTVDWAYNLLSSCTLDERRELPGLDPGRAPVIVAGMVILQEVMSLCGAKDYTVSESDILQGMILSAAAVEDQAK